MKLFLRWTSLVVVLAAAVLWLSAGANRGWTKTSVPNGTVDEVTVNGQTLTAGDGAALSDEQAVEITGRASAQVLVFDLN